MTHRAPRAEPGTGWPGDPATPATPAAHGPAEVAALAHDCGLSELDARVSVCSACPRLVAWREEVARTRRAAFADEPYWGRPAPGFGDPHARLVLVGLAPAAHGANRTGRLFTGDASGDWLFAALHRVGLAALPTSTRVDDGQRLLGARIVSAVRCAPPANRPTPQERDTCTPWLRRELALLAPHVRVLLALGQYAWTTCLREAAALGCTRPSPAPRFGHGAQVVLHRPGSHPVILLGCYHPSQHNTFTGRLTREMTDEVLTHARQLAAAPPQ